MRQLSKWPPDLIKSLQSINNSISSLLKYYINNNLHHNSHLTNHKLREYRSCKRLSHEYKWYFYVIDKCPKHISNDSLRKECEDPDIFSFTPGYIDGIGFFQNRYCVLWHELHVDEFKQIPLNFDCSKYTQMKIDKLIGDQNFTAVRILLFNDCKFTADLIENDKFHGTPGLDPEWVIRQSCIVTNRRCEGCELYCSSFKMYVYPNYQNPFYGSCGIEALKTKCLDPPHPSNQKRSKLPDYSLIFSINGKAGQERIRRFSRSKYRYDTLCESGVKDFFNDICLDLSAALELQGNGLFYLPNKNDLSDPKIHFINIDVDKFSHNSSDTNHTQENIYQCDLLIKNNFIQKYISENKLLHFPDGDISRISCQSTDQTFDDFIDSYYFIKHLLPLPETTTELLFHNVNFQIKGNYCNGSDEAILANSTVFNNSGDFTMIADVEDVKYVFKLNESLIIGKLKLMPPGKNNGNIADFFAITIVCKRNNPGYLGLVTVVCNSISLTFLFITIAMYLLVKSIHKKMVSSIAHLSVSLFLAQLLFQVSTF